ncbi:MAG TPA: hypothetical protein VEK11_00900 [Thermoanaerobaculia bacterium]|nr:hypothetical protein [Thermoanaerobaculia bacterium]
MAAVSRLRRDPALASLVLQDRDLAVLADLALFRFASTPALLRTAAWVAGGDGLQYFAKRLTALWRAGVVERFAGRQSSYLSGSTCFVYTIGSGKATAAARTGIHPTALSADRWRDVLREAAPARDRARDALRCIGMEAPAIERLLHNNTELALKYYAGQTSGVRHRLLAADALSRIWFDARMHGDAVEDIQPDGVADLSFRDPDPRRSHDLITREGLVPIRPDCLFTIARTRYALEAETGTVSAAKLLLKLRRYARRLALDPTVRLVLACASALHAARVRFLLAQVSTDLERAAQVHVANAT